MDRNQFKDMARNNPVDAFMYLFDANEAAELEIGESRDAETALEGRVDALEAAAAPAA